MGAPWELWEMGNLSPENEDGSEARHENRIVRWLKSKRSLLPLLPFVVLAAIGLALAVCFVEGEVLPDDLVTISKMGMVRGYILRYATARGKLPPTLEATRSVYRKGEYVVLDKRKYYKEFDVSDGWGRPLRYYKSEKGGVALVSLGSDAQEGGHGACADIVMSFPAKTLADTWIMDSDWDEVTWSSIRSGKVAEDHRYPIAQRYEGYYEDYHKQGKWIILSSGIYGSGIRKTMWYEQGGRVKAPTEVEQKEATTPATGN